jgi:predicted permease
VMAAATLIREFRLALRTLVRAPGYAAVAILTLALGIGATVAMFAVVNGVLLKPLPYASPDRLVRVYHASPEHGVRDGAVSPADFSDLRAASRTTDAMAAYWGGLYPLTGRGDPIEVHAAFVTEDFFDVLGVPVRHGRPLLADDLRAATPVAVISERLWRTRFDADPGVIGDRLELRDHSLTIVGVASAALRFPIPANDVWLPQTLITADSHGPQDDRGNRYLEVVARLAPGATLDAAQVELDGIAARLASDHPGSNRDWTGAEVRALRDVVIGNVDRTLLLMFAVVGFVLLIGCANLANLMLARASGRTREIAVRTALGASRRRIAGLFATEALVLALGGTAFGLAAAALAVEFCATLSAQTLPRVEELRIDGTVVGFAFAAALLTAALSGILPALRAAGLAPGAGMRGRNALGGERSRARGALVVVQVSLAVVLVVGATLMVRSFHALQSVDPGFDPSRVLTVTMSLNLPGDLDGPGPTAAYLQGRKEQLVEEISALPGVVAVGSVQRLPLAGAGEPMELARPDNATLTVRSDARFVSPGYFAAMGIPLRAGEVFAARPTGDMPPVLISEATARRLWPGDDPVGKTLKARFGEVVVAGVVGDVRQLELASAPEPAVYMAEFYAPRLSTNLVVRTAGNPLTIAGSVRAIVATTDPSQVIRTTMTLEQLLAETLARDRFFTSLFAAFGLLALVLAAVGIYGVLAYAVGQRQQEIGVRMALGASAADVLRLVIASGMTWVGAGVALGLLAAFALSRLMSGLLYGVTATDPATYVAVPLLLGTVALAAAWVPARRATRVDPMTVMRSE